MLCHISPIGPQEFKEIDERLKNKLYHLSTSWNNIYTDNQPQEYTNYALVGDFNIEPGRELNRFVPYESYEGLPMILAHKDSPSTHKSGNDIDHVSIFVVVDVIRFHFIILSTLCLLKGLFRNLMEWRFICELGGPCD